MLKAESNSHPSFFPHSPFLLMECLQFITLNKSELSISLQSPLSFSEYSLFYAVKEAEQFGAICNSVTLTVTKAVTYTNGKGPN